MRFFAGNTRFRPSWPAGRSAIGAVHPHQCERQEEAIPRHPSAFVGEWRQVDYLLYRLRGDGSFGRRRGCFEAQVSERVAQNIHLSEFFIVELFLRAVIDGFDARNTETVPCCPCFWLQFHLSAFGWRLVAKAPIR